MLQSRRFTERKTMNRPPARAAIIGGTALFAIALFIGYRATHPVTLHESISIYIVGIFAAVVILVAAISGLLGTKRGLIAAGGLALALVIWVLGTVHKPGSFGLPIYTSTARIDLAPASDPAQLPKDNPKVMDTTKEIPSAAATK
jgi:hypothetical protein